MDLKDCMTMLEAAQELGVSKSRVEQFVSLEDGRLSVVHVVGNIRLVSRDAVKKLKDAPRKKRGRPKKAAE